jgi:hypothetical protein
MTGLLDRKNRNSFLKHKKVLGLLFEFDRITVGSNVRLGWGGVEGCGSWDVEQEGLAHLTARQTQTLDLARLYLFKKLRV